jgi:quercetin dioxygenase-like cupin family protein
MRSILPALIAGVFLVTLACGQPEEAPLTEDLAELLPAAPEQPALLESAPQHVTALFGNGYAIAMRVDLEPGQEIPEHRAGFRAAYAMSECTLRVTADRHTRDHHFLAGEARSWRAGTYSFENVGDSDAHLVMVTRTETPLPEVSPAGEDGPAMHVDALQGTILIANHAADVFERALAPGKELPLPRAFPRLILAVTPADLNVRDRASQDRFFELDRGDVLWRDAGPTRLENRGDETARLVIFTLRA